MWIARDLDGDLFMYFQKPIKTSKGFVTDWFFKDVFAVECLDSQKGMVKIETDKVQLNAALFPEITWENSPKELEIR